MTGIGGCLGLEPILPSTRGPYHEAPIFSCGRACFRAILEATGPRWVHLPFWMCDVIAATVRRFGAQIRTYGIDDRFEPRVDLAAEQDELVVVVDYFGLNGPAIDHQAARLRERLVIDATQAFFRIGRTDCWTFNSARKFFGVADGAYLWGPNRRVTATVAANPRLSSGHLRARARGSLQRARSLFSQHEAALDDRPRWPLRQSFERLEHMPYRRIARRRRANYLQLHDRLGEANQLDLVPDELAVPLHYPFLGSVPIREQLIERGIFVPTFWPALPTQPGSAFAWERHLVSNLCPLPIDQRYGESEMSQIARTVEELLAE